MRSLLAGWRVSLQRTRADWPIVAAAWLITLLAAVLLAAGFIYPAAASEAGLRRALTDAPVGQTNVVASIYQPAANAQAVDGPAEADLQAVITPLGGSILRDWRGSSTFGIAGLPGSEPGDQAVVGYLDDLASHATLVGGAWPAERGSSGPIQVVVVDAVATALHLRVGDSVPLVAHPSEQPLAVPARLVGIFSVTSAADPYWSADDQLATGIHENGTYRNLGPFLTTQDDLLQHAGLTQVRLQWRVFPRFEDLSLDDAGQLRTRVEGLGERLGVDTGQPFSVTTGLPAILRDAERSLLVSRTGVLLLMAQLSILAAYAIVLTASLLVDHRRVDTALLRSRGAGLPQLALLGAAEGVLLAIPAVLVAPWLAVAALNLLNVVGPLADVGLHIDPRVTTDGYVAAGAAGLACVALLVLPAVLAARGFAAEHGGLSRQETRTFGQRMGLDIALLAITGIAIWQLRLYGAPLTRSVQGALGLDPLLVAAPAIGLMAGGVLALRLLPLLAEAAEAAISRGRDLVASLGSRQMARRPLRYTRSALLLMLAMSMGVFALSYAATWSISQRDQAAYQAGADARVLPGNTLDSLPAWALPSAYRGVAGVADVTPVERISGGINFAAGGSADLLALDAGTGAGIVHFRGDEATASLDTLLHPLTAGRPTPTLAQLPDGTTYLRITPRFHITAISQLVVDEQTQTATDVPIAPDMVTGVLLSVGAVVRDAHGQLYDLEVGPVDVTAAPAPIIVALTPTRERNAASFAQVGARLDGPLTLAGLNVAVWLPQDTTTTSGVLGIGAVAGGASTTGPWTDLQLSGAGPWSAKMGQGQGALGDAQATQADGTSVQIGGDTGKPLFGNGPGIAAAHMTMVPASVAPAGPIPVIVNRAFLAATTSAPGDTITATLDSASRRLEISGVVDSFPTTDPAIPIAIFDEPTLGLLRLQATGLTRVADEWWLSTKPGAAVNLRDALGARPFDSAEVVTATDRARSLSTDPVALGIIGALTLGFIATGLFAIVGLTVSAAVSARQRRTEFALLRALGFSARQLSASLWLENGSLVLVSLLAGTGLGLLIGWLVLPFVTVTQQATAPVPPVLVEIPWDRILLLDGVSALALGMAVVVIGAVLRRLGVGSVLRMGED
ncbi:MAG TPA: FtsX-like permease family protein [Candidatus Dormibacteraeota bacterium]|nr:FtsX-like permease family protein [Candidatus Dormibacteraeota bacterium]